MTTPSRLIAIIGGTGLTQYPDLDISEERVVTTDLGDPSGPLVFGQLAGKPVVFLARHGHPHSVAPHKVNYRANLLALKNAGVTDIVAVNAVGGITAGMDAQAICIPNQIIDYTHGRCDTFFDGEYRPLDHVDFTHPYDRALCTELQASAQANGITVQMGGVYAATQGPRLETAAEIARLEKDGCDVVGMTGMPEAALARELNIPYASVCLVVNKAAGKSDVLITMDDIRRVLDSGIGHVRTVIAGLLAAQL